MVYVTRPRKRISGWRVLAHTLAVFFTGGIWGVILIIRALLSVSR